MGVQWEDDVWFEIVKKEEKKDQSESQKDEESQSESQTTDVTVYEIFDFGGQTLPYSLTIIDTPGFGDTRGTEKDTIISQKLFDLFRSEDGVHEVNVVGLVLKARERSPKSLMTTVEVLKKRIRLTACIQNLQEKIQMIEEKQAVIHETEEALKKFEEEMKTNKDFTVEVDEVYKEKEKIDGVGMWFLVFFEGAVTCNTCEENCHYPGCTMAWYSRDCVVMEKGCCTSCTNKCPAADHVKEKWRYVTKTRKDKMTLQKMKEKYERSKEESEKEQSLLEDLKKKSEKLQIEKDQWLEKAYQHVLILEQIALNVYSLSTFVHLDFLIEKMKERGDTEKVQKLEEMKSREDEGTRAGLLHMYAKMKEAHKSIKELVDCTDEEGYDAP
ncbi:uncharacterized protein LOC127370206 isoform X14 [Xyrichtys novacula]|uniref:Uncharacterized protein LOC127370206 isoform X14 n=1 Tax=Xyrichtys novacula TaxID=13765 RepID=A0AAV1G8T0_XYRNO|nr:uncharacterized protein LOC127370206 isoform X14 [Xyrichtys novacula]